MSRIKSALQSIIVLGCLALFVGAAAEEKTLPAYIDSGMSAEKYVEAGDGFERPPWADKLAALGGTLAGLGIAVYLTLKKAGKIY